MNKVMLELKNEVARQAAIRYIKSAVDGDIFIIKEPTRTISQNALIHKTLTNVGDSINWTFNGVTVDLDDLKSIFMAAYRKAMGQESKFVIGIDGQPVILNWRTRELSKKECSEFIELINSWLANNAQG